MSKKDKINAEITWGQVMFTILTGLLFSIVGRIVTEYENLKLIEIVSYLIACVLIGIMVSYSKTSIDKKIDELEDL